MKLYILVSNGGDGSYSPVFTFDSDLIEKLEKLHNEDILDCESGFSDGDGFHYTTINVPDDSTPETLGVAGGWFISSDYYNDLYKEHFEEE